MTDKYFKIQQALSNSQQRIEELLTPVFGSSIDDINKSKENIDKVSKTLKNSLQDLQKMQIQQSIILNQFKNLTNSFSNFSKISTKTDA